jgi:hypothetical protein
LQRSRQRLGFGPGAAELHALETQSNLLLERERYAEALPLAVGKGDGRSKAMRKIRLKLLDDEKRGHPYYWASFIVSGAWEPITVEDRE